MNSTDNVRNAFHVVYKTYENVHKLMDYTKTIAPEKSHYVSVVDKFLRYKSDNDFAGWFIGDFILIFQDRDHSEFENEWRDGPLYVMEIELYDEDSEMSNTTLPCIRLSKFIYDTETMQGWSKGCSPANHWRFFDPLHNKNTMQITVKNDFSILTPLNQDYSHRNYWDVEKIITKQTPLMDVTADNVVDKIFATFDSL
ncbi:MULTISPECIES: hypothetical protein [unclassified Exiguobacterium]|uniref:hypothetical protein n=1 Tax=unclassified Exiguobacterium TaxID=2644629 RepID=UPI001BE6723B|nr:MULTISPECIES: hypothetical protein [unclassified Exiguobacterium]